MRIRPLASWVICGWVVAVTAPSAEALTVPGNYPTIQAAINAVVQGSAPNGSVIEVQPGVYNEALLVDTTWRSLTVRGVAGPGATIINATGTGRSALRVIRASGAVRFEGLTIRGGSAPVGNGGGFTFEDASPVVANVIFENNTGVDAGGGILTRSNAQFADCVIRANSAARFGGGMVMTSGSRPTFTNCQIRDNVSGTGGAGTGTIGSGGGVHVNDASPTFRGCLITANRSKFAAGGILHMGLFNSAYGPAVLTLEDSEVSNNLTERFAPGENPAEGGGIHIEDNASAYLIRTRVTGNTANTAGGLSAYRARFEITSSVIEGNHAQDPLGVGGFGGGIGISSNNLSMPLRQASSLVVVDSVIRSNDSRIGAGIFATGDQLCGSPTPSCNPATAPRATVNVSDSLIDANAAGVYAGGLRIDRADLTILGSHILRNTVAASGQSYGGGLLMASGTSATIDGTTIARNSAVNFGGGLFVDDGSMLNLTNSRVYGNTAASGGGMYVGSIGPPSGTVQGSVLADNTTYQIHEQACPPLQRTILNYQNNRITPRPGSSDLYYSTCGGATPSISGFNALPSGPSGNTSGPPSFVTFLASPDVGPGTLSWSVGRATSVTIGGVGTWSDDTGAVGVAPGAPTTYTLTNTGGPGSPAFAFMTVARSWGAPGDTPVVGDFDGDGRTDLAVYRGAAGQWFLSQSTAGFRQQDWGAPSLGDTPIPADYDGDGKTDIAVFRQATGEWLIQQSLGGALTVPWGAPALGDVPVAADYDGDGKADIGVYRRSTGQWFLRRSSAGNLIVSWGAPSLGDTPVPSDYDGDGRADIGVYRTTTGQWFISRSSSGLLSVAWGAPSLGDTPVPADYDGDGKADVAIARPATGEWFVRQTGGGTTIARWGFGDSRLPADYDGNGRDEITIWRASSGSWLSRP